MVFVLFLLLRLAILNSCVVLFRFHPLVFKTFDLTTTQTHTHTHTCISFLISIMHEALQFIGVKHILRIKLFKFFVAFLLFLHFWKANVWNYEYVNFRNFILRYFYFSLQLLLLLCDWFSLIGLWCCTTW